MADVEYDLYDESGEPARDDSSLAESAQSLLNWLGAALSVALLGGLVVWGYELTQREVGKVPVLRAVEGPMRVLPEDPGGSSVAHQGLSVAVVPAEGTVAPPPEQVTLAPDPLRLTAADRPQPRQAAAPAAPEPVAQPATQVAAPTPALQAVRAAIAAPAALRLDAPASATVAPAPQPDIAALIEAAEREIGQRARRQQVAGLSRALRPRPRPAGAEVVTRATPAAAVLGAVRAPGEIAPDDLQPGASLAQIGTFLTPEDARTGWQRLAARHDDFLPGRQHVILRAQSGGRAFYRLRVAGFPDMDAARRFCAALQGDGADCIAARHDG